MGTSTIPGTRNIGKKIIILIATVAIFTAPVWLKTLHPHTPAANPTPGADNKPATTPVPATTPSRVTYHITVTITNPDYRAAAVIVRLTVGDHTANMPMSSGFITDVTAQPGQPVHVSMTQVEPGHMECRIQRGSRNGPTLDHQSTTPTGDQPGSITCTTLKIT